MVCTYNGRRWIAEGLEALARQTVNPSEYEVIVVNDGSTDGVEGVLGPFAERCGNFRVISYQPNRGLSTARNIGWQTAQGELVLYIDDDAVADVDWIERIAGEYSPQVDGVGGYARPYIPDVFSLYDQGAAIVVYGADAERLDGAGGLNMSFKRRVLEEIGGFDARFTHIADDADMNRRLTAAGYRLKVVTGITVRHRSATSLRAFCQKKFKRGKLGFDFSKKYGQKWVLPRSLAGMVLAIVNVPRNVAFGVRTARVEKRGDLALHFAALAALERLCISSGRFVAAWGDGGRR